MRDSIGANLRRLRKDRGDSQEQLAERSGVSVSDISRIETGRYKSPKADTLIALANGLDAELSELIGKRPRLDGGTDARVLPLRDALQDPSLLTGGDDDEPVPVDQLKESVRAAWRDYWAGRFVQLTAKLPDLVADTRRIPGPDGAALLAQSYQLTSSILVHFGKDDLAVLGAERAITAAERGDDKLLWGTLHGTYSWTLLHQGRTEAAERHAMWVAEEIEPSMSKATLPHLTVWGAVVLWAMAAAVAGGRAANAAEYIGLARSAAGRFESDRHDYNTNFGRSQVAMQEVHAYTMLRQPGKALKAKGLVDPADLLPISRGRLLIDVAQAQIHRGDHQAALGTLLEANSMPEWFRHQGPGRSLVRELVQDSRRLTGPLRQLAKSVGVDR